jgi:hypothetical protein
MAIESAPGNSSSQASQAASAKPATPPPPSRRWRVAAFLLAGGAQLITIAALQGSSPVSITWSSLLLAIAPVLLGAAAAFGPSPVNLTAAAAGVVVLVAGIPGQITHTGGLFIPALVALGVGGFMLWQEQSQSRQSA